MDKKEVTRDSMPGPLGSNEYKVIIIGGLGVGKTSLLLRYVHDTFEDRVSRFVAEEKKGVTIDGQEIVLDIWDTAGQERFQSITNRFYSDTQAVIIVYDMTSSDNFQDIDFWLREMQYYLLRELEDGMPVIFVGNKKDLLQKEEQEQYDNAYGDESKARDAAATFRQVREISNAHGFLRPIECSAKTGENVQKVFTIVATELIKRRSVRPLTGQTPIIGTAKPSCTYCTS